MAFNGSGVFVRLYNWVNDAAANIKIRADRMDNEFNGMATGLSTCITKDGQTTITANLPMSGFNHTGVAIATASDQYARFDQLQDSAWVGTTSGTDTITATPSPVISAYTAGMTYRMKLGGTNTGAATLNLGPSAKAIQKLGAALVAGDLTTGDTIEVTYDGTQFQLISPARTPVLTAGSITGTAIANDSISNARMADMATATFKGRTTAGTGNPEDLTVTQATALLNVAVGDSGAGGTKGLVPAPAAGDAAKYLRGDMTYVAIASPITLGTMVASTSGTAINFTSLPAGLKRITVNFSGVSTSGTSNWIIQLGDSGGVETSGYLGASSVVVATVASANYTTGIGIRSDTATNVLHGSVVFTLMDASTNLWAAHGTLGQSDTNATYIVGGTKALSATLDRIRITTVGGTDTFDAGNINIAYE